MNKNKYREKWYAANTDVFFLFVQPHITKLVGDAVMNAVKLFCNTDVLGGCCAHCCYWICAIMAAIKANIVYD